MKCYWSIVEGYCVTTKLLQSAGNVIRNVSFCCLGRGALIKVLPWRLTSGGGIFNKMILFKNNRLLSPYFYLEIFVEGQGHDEG